MTNRRRLFRYSRQTLLAIACFPFAAAAGEVTALSDHNAVAAELERQSSLVSQALSRHVLSASQSKAELRGTSPRGFQP